MRGLSAFFVFGDKKRISTLMHWLLDSFDLPCYNLELMERYVTRLLLVCLEEVLEVILHGGN